VSEEGLTVAAAAAVAASGEITGDPFGEAAARER